MAVLLASPSSFIGRESLLAALETRRAAGTRLVTLHGPPGAGKTRTGLEWVRRLCAAGRRAVAVGVVNRANVAAVAAAVADELDLERRETPREALGRMLAGLGPLVLVLDECERLAAELAPVAARWLAEAPELMLVVTSQVVLGVPEEVRLEVPPLSVDEGIHLLRERAGAAGVDLAPAPRAELEAVVRRLDGLPLAIELAAARLPVFSIPGLLRALDDRFRLLKGRAGLPNRRHRSLQASLEDAWSALSEPAQQALAQLSVFEGSFALDAAEAVVRLDAEAWLPDVVDDLCCRSLLWSFDDELVGERRFRMLSCVREFAREHQPPDQASSPAARHAVWFGDRAVRWFEPGFGPRDRHEAARLALEADELARARDQAASPAGTAACALALDVLAAHRRAGADRLDDLARAQAAADAAGDPRAAAAATLARAAALLVSARHDEALATAEAAADIAEASADRPLESACAALVARLSYYRGSYAQCQRWFERALERAAGHPRATGHALVHRGHIEHWEHGPSETTLELLEAGVRALRLAADEYGLAYGEQCLAIALLDAGRASEAEAHTRRVLERDRALDYRVGLKTALGTLGLICHERGALDDAAAHYEEARDLCRAIGTWFSFGLYTGYLGCVAFERGDGGRALELLDDAIEAFARVDNRRHQAMYARYAALVAAAANRALPVAIARLAEVEFDFGADRWLALAMDLLRRVTALVRDRAPAARYAALRRALAAEYAELLPDDAPPRSWELRHALRLLGLAERSAASAGGPRIGPGGAWFLASDGTRVELERQPLLARIVARLGEAQVAEPGRPLAADELIRAGWPDERMHAEAAATRLHTAVRRLRKLGLSWLRSNRAGYWLDDGPRA